MINHTDFPWSDFLEKIIRLKPQKQKRISFDEFTHILFKSYEVHLKINLDDKKYSNCKIKLSEQKKLGLTPTKEFSDFIILFYQAKISSIENKRKSKKKVILKTGLNKIIFAHERVLSSITDLKAKYFSIDSHHNILTNSFLLARLTPAEDIFSEESFQVVSDHLEVMHKNEKIINASINTIDQQIKLLKKVSDLLKNEDLFSEADAVIFLFNNFVIRRQNQVFKTKNSFFNFLSILQTILDLSKSKVDMDTDDLLNKNREKFIKIIKRTNIK